MIEYNLREKNKEKQQKTSWRIVQKCYNLVRKQNKNGMVFNKIYPK